jgi:hypothetical protein
VFISLEMDQKFWSVLIPKIGWFKNIPRILRVYIPYHRDGFKSRQFAGWCSCFPTIVKNPCMTNGCWGKLHFIPRNMCTPLSTVTLRFPLSVWRAGFSCQAPGSWVVPLLSVCNATSGETSNLCRECSFHWFWSQQEAAADGWNMLEWTISGGLMGCFAGLLPS